MDHYAYGFQDLADAEDPYGYRDACPVNADVVDEGTLSITSISSRVDSLSYAVGTSTGHTLLYDNRAAKPFTLKDQGYAVKNVTWIAGGSRMVGDGMVLSANKKVIKIWDRHSVGLFYKVLATINNHPYSSMN